MAHFRAVIKGQRGEASRLGSARSGIDATVNGWTGGVRVEANVNGEDCFAIFATKGSGNPHAGDYYLGYVNGNGMFVPSPELRDGIVQESLEAKPDDSGAFCNFCGAEWPDSTTPCPNCGREL